MNATARQLKLTDTHYANPIGLDSPGNYSTATDLAKLTLILRRNAFFRETTNLPRVTLKSGATRARSPTATCSCATCRRSTASRPATPARAGYILVGSASRAGVTVVAVVLDDPSESARDSDALNLLATA